MSTVSKMITLSQHQDGWIKAQITAGNYTSDSEFIHALIRRDQERVAEIEAIQTALIVGENSGQAVSFDVSAFKQRMRAELG